MLDKLKALIQSLCYYVIVDPADNSMTLSKRLFTHMKRHFGGGDKAHVFVFRIPSEDAFGFSVNPDIDRPTQLCDIQYNGKYKCIGFETLCPSVGMILYEYELDGLHPVKLSVSVHTAPQGRMYYRIDRPSTKLAFAYGKIKQP